MAVKGTSKRGHKVGVIESEEIHGEFCEAWQCAMNEYKFKTIDITTSIDFILATKEEEELFIIHDACNVVVDIMQNYLNERIVEAINRGEVSCCLIFVRIENASVNCTHRSIYRKSNIRNCLWVQSRR